MELQFDALNEEQAVTFEVEKSPKGPRAINVRIATATATEAQP
jgi:cold shock CspA family protein